MVKRKLHFSAWQFILAFVVVTFSTSSVYSQDAAVSGDDATATETVDIAAGEALFKANCASCHKLYKKAVGPALHLVSEKYDRDWLYSWIKNSAAMVASGDAQAVAIYNEYNQTAMNAFPQLTNADIDNILAYTDTPKPEPPKDDDNNGTADSAAPADNTLNTVVLAVLALVMLLLVYALFTVNRTLQNVVSAKQDEDDSVEDITQETGKPLWKAFVENQFLVLVSVIFMLLISAYFAYGALMSVGVDQGYAPVQPIHYSHRIHAGDNEIDCKYCHSSARESKHSGIPSLNVCMNCHKSISEVADDTYQQGMDEYGVDYNKEIEKLYAATGWNPDDQAYTGDPQPVRWVRIHNLPDLAYFNHAQHVTAGNIECQTCHGPVEEMEVMYQYSPLTMGWCINCHRETNVDLENNGYYEKIHEELSKKRGGKKLTIADLGGLECGKCHY